MLSVTTAEKSFILSLDGREIIRHTPQESALFLGKGQETIRMYRGNFDVSDRVSERIALRFARMDADTAVFTSPELAGEYRLRISEEGGLVRLTGAAEDARFDRLWLRFSSESDEHVTGGGEQFSMLDLRGRLFPIWTREQGVGRNKLTEITRLADCSDGGGGDYHTTFFPQPTFLSSRLYFAHLENYEYSELDFRAARFHELALWSTSLSLVLGAGESFRELLEKLTGLLGRQRELPDWAMRGIWLGAQGGTARVTELLERCRAGGMDVSAVWIQDWEGKRVTSFGKRLQWDWRWNREMYPGLDGVIAADPDTRWMGYMNPYLVEGGVLFREAAEKGYFVKNAAGEDYLFDFGEYDCGVVDLTRPAAFEWYKNVIKQNLIGLGFRGWMADFGEYLPADAVCCCGSGLEKHNAWPMLWAKCCREAVEESGLLGDCVFYMRAGAAGSQRYSTLIWAGDQCVDWSDDDGARVRLLYARHAHARGQPSRQQRPALLERGDHRKGRAADAAAHGAAAVYEGMRPPQCRERPARHAAAVLRRARGRAGMGAGQLQLSPRRGDARRPGREAGGAGARALSARGRVGAPVEREGIQRWGGLRRRADGFSAGVLPQRLRPRGTVPPPGKGI